MLPGELADGSRRPAVGGKTIFMIFVLVFVVAQAMLHTPGQANPDDDGQMDPYQYARARSRSSTPRRTDPSMDADSAADPLLRAMQRESSRGSDSSVRKRDHEERSEIEIDVMDYQQFIRYEEELGHQETLPDAELEAISSLEAEFRGHGRPDGYQQRGVEQEGDEHLSDGRAHVQGAQAAGAEGGPPPPPAFAQQLTLGYASRP